MSRKKRLETLGGKGHGTFFVYGQKKHCPNCCLSRATHMVCFVLLAFVCLPVKSILFCLGKSLKSCLQELKREGNTEKAL